VTLSDAAYDDVSRLYGVVGVTNELTPADSYTQSARRQKAAKGAPSYDDIHDLPDAVDRNHASAIRAGSDSSLSAIAGGYRWWFAAVLAASRPRATLGYGDVSQRELRRASLRVSREIQAGSIWTNAWAEVNDGFRRGWLQAERYRPPARAAPDREVSGVQDRRALHSAASDRGAAPAVVDLYGRRS
jgi:hypothetical protein